MNDTHQKHWKDEELEAGSDIEKDIETRILEEKNAKETRLATLRTLLNSRNERRKNMHETRPNETLSEKLGPTPIESKIELPNGGATNEEKDSPSNPSLNPHANPNWPLPVAQAASPVLPPGVVEPPSGKLALSISSTLPTSEMIESESMSLLDESANHMFALMKGLHANQPPAEIKAFDSDRVNSAVACANTIYKIMRLKLDAIKVKRKLTK